MKWPNVLQNLSKVEPLQSADRWNEPNKQFQNIQGL